MDAAALVLPTTFAAFLSPGECRTVIGEIDAAHQAQAEIWGDGGFGVHPDSRRGAIAKLPSATEVLVQDRLWDVMDALEERFGCSVSHVSGVTALIYCEGDHFAAHSDGGGDDESPAEIRRRRVSLVLALNDGEADFTGGALDFYAGAAPEVASRVDPVMSVRSRPGTLIAFGSSTIHRVAPVITGRRYSLALWALAPAA
jgi:predicted 2-oxoglutarate/Fe(II)-dependent dioxygenase YbiX